MYIHAMTTRDIAFETSSIRIRSGSFFATGSHEMRHKQTRMYEDCVLQSMRFPHKLWRIVTECRSGAIRWGTNGDTILLDYKKFQAEYLDARRPIFKTSNITSFIRQLNLYGFRKVTTHSRDPICNSHDSHVHEFLHDNFRAEHADLLSQVCRKTGGKSKCFQYDALKSIDSIPRSEVNCISRLKLCQVLLILHRMLILLISLITIQY